MVEIKSKEIKEESGRKEDTNLYFVWLTKETLRVPWNLSLFTRIF